MARHIGLRTVASGLIALGLAAGCGDAGANRGFDPQGAGTGGQAGGFPSKGGSPGSGNPSSAPVTLSSPQQEQLDALEGTLSELDDLDPQALVSRYPTKFANELGYDPKSAVGLDT